MKTCNVCKAMFPGFMTRCLRCDCSLGAPSETYGKPLKILKNYRTLRKRYGQNSVYVHMANDTLNGATPESIEAKVRQDLRNEIQLFYDGLANRVGLSYPRDQLRQYLAETLSGSAPVAQCLQTAESLVATLYSLSGLREEREEQRRQEIAQRRAEDERRREEERLRREEERLREEGMRQESLRLLIEQQQLSAASAPLAEAPPSPAPPPRALPPPAPRVSVKAITEMIRRLTALGATPEEIAAAVAAATARIAVRPGTAVPEAPMTQDDFGTL